MSVSDTFLDADFKYVSRISLLHTTFVLRQDIKVCFYSGRHEEFSDFFSLEDGVVFFNDVCSIMEVLGHEHNPDS